jgi:hypothetical protein
MNAFNDDADAARRKPRARAPKGAESRLFSGSKMARVLHRLGVDFRAFVEEYDQDVSRSSRAAPLSKGERAAIEEFLTHGQIRRLAKELACSVGSAQSRVTRFALERSRP